VHNHDSAPAVRRMAGTHSHLIRHWYLQPPGLPSVSSRNSSVHIVSLALIPGLLQPEHVSSLPFMPWHWLEPSTSRKQTRQRVITAENSTCKPITTTNCLSNALDRLSNQFLSSVCLWTDRLSNDYVHILYRGFHEVLHAAHRNMVASSPIVRPMSHLRQSRATLTRDERSRVKVASVTGRVARCVMVRRTVARLVFGIERCHDPWALLNFMRLWRASVSRVNARRRQNGRCDIVLTFQCKCCEKTGSRFYSCADSDFGSFHHALVTTFLTDQHQKCQLYIQWWMKPEIEIGFWRCANSGWGFD